MANRNYEVCKACFQRRLSIKENIRPDGLAAAVMSQMAMESKTGQLKGWSFCLCPLEPTNGFDEDRMPPPRCPFAAEHAVSSVPCETK